MRRLLLLFLVCSTAFPAYRVYRLKIQVYNNYGKLKKIYYTLSNLDYLQYEHYYGGYKWMKVTLVDTWFCPGDTSHLRKYCDKPEIIERSPASSTPKRVELPFTRQPVIP